MVNREDYLRYKSAFSLFVSLAGPLITTLAPGSALAKTIGGVLTTAGAVLIRAEAVANHVADVVERINAVNKVLQDMKDNGRQPTDAEWDALSAQISAASAAIQAS